ncbi:MAG: DM13 domain-containing protein [Acidimicrobiales bacterium]
MELLATGSLSGPEARAAVRIIDADQGPTIELSDLWVAPGAPDVRLFASPHADGTIDTTSTELGLVPYGETVQRWPFPSTLGADQARSVVVYCHIYSVHFGHAEMEWLAQ